MKKVAVMGCGIVGSGVIKMLTDNRDQIGRATGVDVRLIHALDVREVALPDGVKFTSDFQDLINDCELDIAVETIGGVGVAYKFTKALLEKGVSVVSSNKELVVAHGDELKRIAYASCCEYLYEASVGGGVPIIRPLRCDLAGNNITKILGIVNGSTNYLLTRMKDVQLSFSAAIAEAKDLGYMEANPDADVLGWDAKRKLSILSNTAFGASFSDCERIEAEGIAQITDRDMVLADALGGSIKLIASSEIVPGGWTGWVNPALLPDSNPLSRVNDVFNGILVTGDFVDDVMFYGRGAGSLPTASAIISDIIELARGAKPVDAYEYSRPAPEFRSPGDYDARLMVRIETDEKDELRAMVSKKFRDAELTRVQDMFALVTPVMKYGALIEKLNSLKCDNVRMGIPIRVL